MLAIELRQRGLIELAIVGDAPELVKVAQVLWRPDWCSRGANRSIRHCGSSAAPGFAYFCRDHVCDQPVDTPEALYEKITGRPVPEGRQRSET